MGKKYGEECKVTTEYCSDMGTQDLLEIMINVSLDSGCGGSDNLTRAVGSV